MGALTQRDALQSPHENSQRIVVGGRGLLLDVLAAGAQTAPQLGPAAAGFRLRAATGRFPWNRSLTRLRVRSRLFSSALDALFVHGVGDALPVIAAAAGDVFAGRARPGSGSPAAAGKYSHGESRSPPVGPAAPASRSRPGPGRATASADAAHGRPAESGNTGPGIRSRGCRPDPRLMSSRRSLRFASSRTFACISCNASTAP